MIYDVHMYIYIYTEVVDGGCKPTSSWGAPPSAKHKHCMIPARCVSKSPRCLQIWFLGGRYFLLTIREK